MALLRLSFAAALSLVVAASAAAEQPPVVTIRVGSFYFSPKPIELQAGRPVRMEFVNESGSSHDFTAHSFFHHARILQGSAPEGEIELQGHQTVSIELVPAIGRYAAHCSHFFHKQLGMNVAINVR